ncbi:MAG: hypothetical protein Q7R34_06905, partial [Dehalococcoidia bacterium]|nr:hypothetical protein [Dehalococcoidia bacterium]
IRYSLTEEASPKIRKEQKERLISQLETALRTIMEAGLLNTSQKAGVTIQHVWKSSSFMLDSDIVAKATFPGSPDARRDIVWFNGPQAFLRIIPTTPAGTWTPFVLENLIKSGGLISMGDKGNTSWILRNTKGAVHVSGQDNGKPDTYIKALCLTQVFQNGEIWGIEGYSLGEEVQTARVKTPIRYIPAGFVENLFSKTLQNYLDWVKASLKLKPPLKYIAGLSGIAEYPISIDSHHIDGYCVDDEVISTGEIADYEVDVTRILIPFFKNIWECCGVTRPDKLS